MSGQKEPCCLLAAQGEAGTLPVLVPGHPGRSLTPVPRGPRKPGSPASTSTMGANSSCPRPRCAPSILGDVPSFQETKKKSPGLLSSEDEKQVPPPQLPNPEFHIALQPAFPVTHLKSWERPCSCQEARSCGPWGRGQGTGRTFVTEKEQAN